MSEKIYFHLTEEQSEILAPLFKQVDEAFVEGKKGSIFGQFKKGSSVAVFIPEKYAKRIHEIIQEMEKDEEKAPTNP